jgi:hypothetical protein
MKTTFFVCISIPGFFSSHLFSNLLSMCLKEEFEDTKVGSPPVYSGVRITRSLNLCVCFVDRCLSFCTFFWPLWCLFFFHIRILITTLVSSNSSFNNIEIHIHIHTHISVETKFDNIGIHIHVHTHIPVETKFDNIEIQGHSFFRLKFYPVERI